MMNGFKIGAVFAAAVFSAAVSAQGVDIKNAWARATVPGQKATGVFMTLQSSHPVRLISADSSAAGVAEVHEMSMENNVMRMRAVQGGLVLPAHKAVELKPGGYHVMLMDLKQPLLKDTSVQLTLVFKDAKGLETKTELKVPVLNMPPTGMTAPSPHANQPTVHHGY